MEHATQQGVCVWVAGVGDLDVIDISWKAGSGNMGKQLNHSQSLWNYSLIHRYIYLLDMTIANVCLIKNVTHSSNHAGIEWSMRGRLTGCSLHHLIRIWASWYLKNSRRSLVFFTRLEHNHKAVKFISISMWPISLSFNLCQGDPRPSLVSLLRYIEQSISRLNP